MRRPEQPHLEQGQARKPSRVRIGQILLCALCSVMLLPMAGAADELPDLPEGIASFGAAVAGDSLYVFGGHVGKTHQHSVENIFHRFLRLDLSKPTLGWQTLGDVEGLQGLPMVSDGQRVCRFGGLEARNFQDDETEDLHSLADVSCFDPAKGDWQSLPPLTRPRSSHDAVRVGHRLYVLGGWQLRGVGEDPVWHDQMEVLDLAAKELRWTTVAQPFQRRALAVAAAGGRVYAFGGLASDGTSRQVDVYDIETGTWSPGPALPEMAEKRMKGFGVSAFGVDDRIYLSAADGIVHALDAGAEAWQEGLATLHTPRFFHRLLHHGGRLLFVAGAAKSGHLASIESLDIASLIAGSAGAAQVGEAEASASTTASHISGRPWPGFRGTGDGHAAASEVPLHWSAEDNIAWRVELPGYGQSAPVVWGDQAFVISVEGAEKEILILSSLALVDGEVLWRRRFAASQLVESSDMVSRGAPTPVVDGERVVAFWESGDLIALDHHGETLWKRSLTDDYGEFEGNHGIASSPVLTDDAVVVQISHAGPSYVVAIDQRTGETRWKVDLPSAVAWTTPYVARGRHGKEIISSAAGRVEALDAATGDQLWVLHGIEKSHIPSPVVEGDLVVVASSEPGHSLALHRGTLGELKKEDIVWRSAGVTSGFGSPLIHGQCVLLTNKAGGVHCLDRTTGEERWRHRVADALWASPIAAGEHLFFFTKKGQTTVLRATAEGPVVVAENLLPTDDTVYGVAVADSSFLIRTGQEMVRVGR